MEPTRLEFYTTPTFGPKEARRAGMLVKYSTGKSALPKPKNWKRRLLVLLQGEIHWYEATEIPNRSSSTYQLRVERQLGKLPIDASSEVSKDDDALTALPFTFSITSGGTTLTLQARSREERERWVASVQECILPSLADESRSRSDRASSATVLTAEHKQNLAATEAADFVGQALERALEELAASDCVLSTLCISDAADTTDAASGCSDAKQLCFDGEPSIATLDELELAMTLRAEISHERSITPPNGRVLFSAELGGAPAMPRLPIAGSVLLRPSSPSIDTARSLDLQLGSGRESQEHRLSGLLTARADARDSSTAQVASSSLGKRSSFPVVGMLAERMMFWQQPVRPIQRRG